MNNRAYETRRDLLELHTLLDSGMRPVDIAREMGKDPAWVSRSTRRLRQDPTLAFRTPQEGEVIVQTEARLELLYQQAFRAAMSCTGQARIAAVRVAGSMLRQLTDYRVRVGLLEERKRCTFIETEDAIIRVAQALYAQKDEMAALGS